MTESMGVAELKRRFSEVLNRIEVRGERVLVQRHGRAVAMLSRVPEGSEETVPRVAARGLAAAAGAWREHEDIDGFLEDLRASRDAASDRSVESFE